MKINRPNALNEEEVFIELEKLCSNWKIYARARTLDDAIEIFVKPELAG